jgi:hypothetical protein
MLRGVPHTVPRVGRSNEHFPDGFEVHLLRSLEMPSALVSRCRANMAHIRQSSPDSGLGFQVRVPKKNQAVPYVAMFALHVREVQACIMQFKAISLHNDGL